jgi:ABC-type nitrate/sulfonate/bicarbonate transport system substrate-binding protein
LAITAVTPIALLSFAQDKKLDSFTISYASVSGTRGPLWIAKDLGLFEKYGLEGNLIYIASGVVSVNALLGGSVDIIAASGSSAVGAAARGAPIVIIASLGHIAYKLIALPSIKTVQDLKGKIIGSSRVGAGSDFALQRLLRKLGLTPGKDVQLIPTGVSESDRRLLMMMQGKIDATLGTEDNILQLGNKGLKFSILADLYDAGVYTTGSDIATSRVLVKQRPRQLKAFLMAITEDHAHLPEVYEDRRSKTPRVDAQELSTGLDSCAAISQRRSDTERYRGLELFTAASARQKGRGVFGSIAFKEHGRRRIFQAARKQIALAICCGSQL